MPKSLPVALLILSIVCSVVRAESPGWLFVSLLNARKIVTCERDAKSGLVTRRDELDCPAEPAILSASPDRRTLFASFRSTGQLASFTIDPETGRLTPRSVVDGGADPAYLQSDRTGRYLLSAYYQANKVTVHAIARDGSLSALPLQTVPTAEKAHGIGLDTGNRMVFVTHTGANRIYQFQFDQAVGRLTAATVPFTSTPTDYHPRHIALHPTNRWAYVNNEAGDSLSVYEVEREAARLTRIQTISTLPDDFDGAGNSTARCEMTPDGRSVYVANRGHDSIAGFAVEPGTGRVTSLGQFPTEKTPRSFTIESSGRFLYVAGEASGRIAVYRIMDNGALQPLETCAVGPVAWSVLAVDGGPGT